MQIKIHDLFSQPFSTQSIYWLNLNLILKDLGTNYILLCNPLKFIYTKKSFHLNSQLIYFLNYLICKLISKSIGLRVLGDRPSAVSVYGGEGGLPSLLQV